jgi:TetR/AcrR family transcriptional regulator, transcriptional repressor of bet genes
MGRVDVHAIRREQILAAAERLLARNGWARTTFADICKEAGISNGVLTYHFKDKDEILLAVLEKVSRTSSDRFFSLLQEQTSWPGKLDLIVHSNLSSTAEEREMSMLNLHLLSLAAQRPEIAQRLRQTYAFSMQRAQAEIEQAIEQGQIKRHDSAAVAAVIQMLVIGMSFGSLILDLTVPTEQLMDEVLTLLRCYLGTDDEEQKQK